jgi:hypothetical protein
MPFKLIRKYVPGHITNHKRDNRSNCHFPLSEMNGIELINAFYIGFVRGLFRDAESLNEENDLGRGG